MKSLNGFRLKRWSICIQIVWSLCNCTCGTCSEIEKKIPAIYAFGDSIVDPGNNNNMLTLIRCDFPPYGRDFEGHRATGRFSNGRITGDFLADELGVKRNLPAYLDTSLKDEDLLTGVSFASSGCGLDPLTHQIFFVTSMNQQLEMFKEYIGKIIGIVGLERTNYILNNSISFIVAGSDDVSNTYFSTPFRRGDYDFDSYSDLMLSFASTFIKKLYKLGARKIGVSNLPPLGYLPSRRTLAGGLTRECVHENNELAQLFNSKLKDELQNLTPQLPNSKLVYIDLYSITFDLILNHTNYGFEVVDRGCCGSGLIEVAVLCNPFSVVLCDVNKYIFWDSYHPSERAYQIINHQIVQKYKHLFF